MLHALYYTHQVILNWCKYSTEQNQIHYQINYVSFISERQHTRLLDPEAAATSRQPPP